MLSKAQISLITSLQNKKYRKQHGLFIVEGIKSVKEFISSSYQVESIFYTDDANTKVGKISHNIKSHELTEAEFQKISTLKSPQGVLALVKLPKQQQVEVSDLRNCYNIVLMMYKIPVIWEPSFAQRNGLGSNISFAPLAQ
ncbi:RNA methyltransferase substrate-binding domain-containing protein [Sphingobacterium sp. E70]|uniref:RNA methyltransferase substrate-binding domain-containing protein n=1 Tax=Sphingobacterium sp. E70 TaxID=2853439 RepID=UPI002795A63F|nr:RNA methyltransferase substrate-binding domain-containing protein [Sphingobacterium sp. E70]